MPYNFTSLLPADFADLACDLVGKMLGVRFEAFRPGPDGGIDGRHAKEDGNVVLQAKHYVGSSFPKLKAAMKKERASIDRLESRRYILATSRQLSPPNKAALAAVIGPALLREFRAIAAGLARRQSDTGLWHQLLDRPDTYLETSASAIFAFALARGVNRGWLDPTVYGPVAILAWNGVTTKVNAAGEVEDVVVGTGMGFEPAFYAYRPRHVAASHGYGPVLLAGAEVLALLRQTKNDRQGVVNGYTWRAAPPTVN